LRRTVPLLLCAVLLAATACSGQAATPTTTLPSGDLAATSTTIASGASPTSATTTTVPPTTTSPALFSPLTEGYGGGVGFLLGSVDQTARLSVAWYGPWPDFESGPLPMVIVLPNEKWRAVLALGTNLFDMWGYGNLGNRVVRERWPIVAGTITIVQLPPSGECGEARAHLEGLEAERPDGTRIRLGDFEVRNARWGCLMA
jgi:hypothetical protein